MILRILASDPGKQKSRFGVGLLELHGQDIWIKAAAQFGKKKYRVMEQYMATIHKNNPVTHVVVEKNNVGIHVIESLKDEHHLPVFAITTTNKVTDQKKLLSARSMPKIEHAEWLEKFIENGHLKYPIHDTPGHRALRTQVSKVTKKITQAGTITYSTDGNEPDDMWMMLMVGTWVIRKLFLGGHAGIIASAKYTTAIEQKSKKEEAIDKIVSKVMGSKNLGTATSVKVEIQD